MTSFVRLASEASALSCKEGLLRSNDSMNEILAEGYQLKKDVRADVGLATRDRFLLKKSRPLPTSELCQSALSCAKSNEMMTDGIIMAEPSVKPIELSFPMPKAPETRIHLHLTIQMTSLLLFLTTALNGNTSEAAPLGSFVYALPDVCYLLPISIQLLDRMVMLINLTETKFRSNTLDPALHVRIIHRVHNTFGEVVGTENWQACLCG